MIDYAFIGARLKEARIRKNMTQEQLAEELGVSNKTVSKWENGKCMPDYRNKPATSARDCANII